MKRLIIGLVSMMQILCMWLPSVGAQTSPVLSGTYYANDPAAFIQSFTIEGTDIDIHIHPGWTSIPETRMMEFFQFNQKLQEKLVMKIDPAANATDIQKFREAHPYVDMTHIMAKVTPLITNEMTYKDLIYTIESQVPGLYFHPEDILAPYFHVGQGSVIESGNAFIIKVLDTDLLTLTKVTAQSFSLDGVTYALNAQFSSETSTTQEQATTTNSAPATTETTTTDQSTTSETTVTESDTTKVEESTTTSN